MTKKITKKILAFVMAIAMVLTLAGVPSLKTEAAAPKKVKKVRLKIGSSVVTNKKYTMTVGQKKTVKVTVTPKAAKKKITFKSSKKKVAAITKKGKITAKSAGKSKITVTVMGKNKKKVKKYINLVVKKKPAKKPVQKEVAVTGVTASISPASIRTGEKAQITATVSPANATNKTLTYSSDKKGVAEVDSKGTVTGISAGTAVIKIGRASCRERV